MAKRSTGVAFVYGAGEPTGLCRAFLLRLASIGDCRCARVLVYRADVSVLANDELAGLYAGGLRCVDGKEKSEGKSRRKEGHRGVCALIPDGGKFVQPL